MALKTSFRSRRLNKYKSNLTEKLIAFPLNQQWFALSIKNVVKLITVDKFYCNLQQAGVSFTTYQNQEILIVDLGYYLFLEQFKLQENTQTQYLIIVQNSKQEIIGIPIDSQPIIFACDDSAFKDLVKIKIKSLKIKSVSTKIVEIDDDTFFFLLDPEQLFLINN